MYVDTALIDTENATRKQSNKPANLTIKTDEEMAEKSFDSQPPQKNELSVIKDVENIVKCKKSPKKDKKLKKKSRESFSDSLNGSNLDGIPEIRYEANIDPNEEPHKKHKKIVVNDNVVSSSNNANTGKNEEPYKKKHKKRRVVNDNEVSIENNEDNEKDEELYKNKHKKKWVVNDNQVSSEHNADNEKNEEPHKKKHKKKRVVNENEVSSANNADTEKNEEPHKKKHKKKMVVNDNDASSGNNAGHILPSVRDPKAINLELADEVVTAKGIGLSDGVDDTPQIISEVNTVKNEEQQKKKHKKRKMDKMRAENDSVLFGENISEENPCPSVCNPNAATNLELANEVMTGSGISLSKGVDTTPEIRSETSTVENEESPKKKHKKRKTDKKRAVNDSELGSENNSESNLYLSVCNLNAITNLELATEAMTVGGISSQKGANDTHEIILEADTMEIEKSPKKKHKERKTDKKRAAIDSELLSENNLDVNLCPSVCSPNATVNLELATDAIADSGISLSRGGDDTAEIRSEVNTVKNEEPQEKKRKKRKMDKNSAVNDSKPLGENNPEGKYYPSVCDPNATTDLELTTQNMTADGISSSKVVDDAPEIRLEANTVNSENPQKKKRKKKRKKKKSSVASDSGTLENSLKENIPPLMGVCVSNASVNIELADNKSGVASQLVNKQLTANESSSKCANNSDEVDLISIALEKNGLQKKREHEETRIDGQDCKNKCLEAKNIEISQDNVLLPSIENEIHTRRTFGRRKLLVLDLNGLLCEVIKGSPRTKKPYKKFGRFAVFKRPFCDDFMKFCCENFDIGVWSSRKAENVDGVVNVVMKNFKDELLFCWSQSECTCTPHNSMGNRNKPLVLKKLQKLWNKEEGNLPWELGDYSPSNTLLIDDSPYKALCNPPYAGVFPCAYNYHNERDNALGPGGSLRVYLEGLALAEDVESYVREHPFGKPAITPTNPAWSFYEKIINEYK